MAQIFTFPARGPLLALEQSIAHYRALGAATGSPLCHRLVAALEAKRAAICGGSV
jgi:hypothetical protein